MTYSSWTDTSDDSEGFASHCFFISLPCTVIVLLFQIETEINLNNTWETDLLILTQCRDFPRRLVHADA